ncbi:NAD(+)/NADH kinase [Halobacteria archaeon AArc-dxtr1]|nr:NAD(+)/NADH kinase [Halobacteria archaeon AArc-dxtr1]
MDTEGWSAGESPTVAVLEGDAPATSGRRVTNAVAGAVDGRDASSVSGDATAIGAVLDVDPTFLVVSGEQALTAAVRAEVSVPVLPVTSNDHGTELDGPTPNEVAGAVSAVLDGCVGVCSRPIISVTTDGESTADGISERALFDVTLVTDEPARISEYAVASRGEHVARFRADGVVVATPAGTRGYAGSVGAPEVAPTVPAVAVTPIAPFVTHANRWVLPEDALSLTVERDEDDISLAVDGRLVDAIGTETRVELAVESSIRTLVVGDRTQN